MQRWRPLVENNRIMINDHRNKRDSCVGVYICSQLDPEYFLLVKL